MLPVLLLLVAYFFLIINYRKSAIAIFILSPFLDLYLINSAASVYSVISLIMLFMYPLRMKGIKEYKLFQYPFLWYIYLLLSSMLITDILSPEKHFPSVVAGILKVSVNVMIVWTILENDRGKYIQFFLNIVLLIAFIISIYGVIEAITRKNLYLDLMERLGYFPYDNIIEIRYGLKRTFSIFFMHITNGVVSIGLFFILLYARQKNILKKNKSVIIVLILLTVNIFATGARSVIISFFILLLSFYDKKWLKPRNILVIVCFSCIIFYYLGSYFDEIFDSIVNTDKINGSNSDMRDNQLSISLFYWFKSFVYGNGIGFIGKVMHNDIDIAGAESVWFPIMVERGLIGILVCLMLFIGSFIYCIKKDEKSMCFYVLSLFVLYTMTSVPNVEVSNALFFILVATIINKYNTVSK